MKKTLIALAVLGSIAGVAQAQSNVTIYGKLDQGLRDMSNANTSTVGTNADSKVQLTNRAYSRIGFKGSEDLGGGLSAIFQFENRFLADTGMQFGTALFHAQSNVGLKGNFGTVRLGRIYNPVDDIGVAMDPFGQDGIGSMQLNALTVTRQDNSLRYDSPNFSGFGVQAIYSLKEATVGGVKTAASLNATTGAIIPAVLFTAAELNDGYGVAVSYANGPISAAAGWNRKTNTNKSDYWSIGGGYAFGPAKITALYEDAKLKNVGPTEVKQKNALIGVAYNIGAGTINASFGRLKSELAGQSIASKKLAVGYTHNLSKRTSLYANAARTDWDRTGVDNTNGAEIGVTHNF
ncbi:MAG: porin [Oxalobacteraceae bacterium]